MQYRRAPLALLLALMSGTAAAHDGILPHPETHSELAHFIVHLWMAAAVIAGAGFLIRGIKRYLGKHTDQTDA